MTPRGRALVGALTVALFLCAGGVAWAEGAKALGAALLALAALRAWVLWRRAYVSDG